MSKFTISNVGWFVGVIAGGWSIAFANATFVATGHFFLQGEAEISFRLIVAALATVPHIGVSVFLVGSFQRRLLSSLIGGLIAGAAFRALCLYGAEIMVFLELNSGTYAAMVSVGSFSIGCISEHLLTKSKRFMSATYP